MRTNRPDENLSIAKLFLLICRLPAKLCLSLVLAQIGSEANGLQESSQGSDVAKDSNTIAELFHSANKSYMAGDYRNAINLYEEVAGRCKGTELSIQCEYFAAISSWNTEPNQASASKLESWLRNAKAHQQKLEQSGSKVASPSWPHWIQSAFILLAKWESARGQLDQARIYLNESLTESELHKVGESRIHYELGFFYAKFDKDLAKAKLHLNKAMESVGTDDLLKNKILLSHARATIELGDAEAAHECLQNLIQTKLSNQQKIEATVLQGKIVGHNSRDLSTISFWREATDSASQGDVEPIALMELASMLREVRLRDEANQILSELIKASPNHPLSVEARVHLAYHAASQKDWQRVHDLTLAAVDLGQLNLWSTYAMYLNARAKIERGDTDEGVSLLASMLTDSDLPKDLRTTLHLDLAHAFYLSESWDKMVSHVDWLAEEDSQGTLNASLIPRVRMWQAELLAHDSKWDESERIVSAIRSDFPEWNRRSEVDYLLARCLIARAEFDSARTILHEIVMPVTVGSEDTSKTPTVLAARASWMIGETYMMQQRYDEASLAYGEVLRFPTESFWCAASIVQKGLCAEQLNRFQEAKEHYEKVITDYSETAFAQTARTRIAGISFSTQQVERIGSGSKR